MRQFFDRLDTLIRGTESSIVNVISAFAPWLAPLAPAYMTYQHAVGTLQFPILVAAPVALVVEILGFSTVSTYMEFHFFNRRNKAEGKKAPTSLVVLAFGFYLGLIVASNVLLDTFPGAVWALVTVRALFTLQTVPAAVIVAVRTQHRDMIDKIVSERTNERTNGGTPSERTRIRMVRPGHTEVRRKIEDFVHQVESEQNRTPGVSETSRALGVSKAYASETLKAMGSNGHSDET